MRTEIIEMSRKADWEHYIYENPSSIAWQSYDWSTVLRRHYQFDFYPIAVFDNSKICGVLPLYHLRTARGKEQLISVPYAVAGGIVADHEQAEQALLKRALELSEKHNMCPITFKQYKRKIGGPLSVDDNFYNRELDISQEPETTWNALAVENRQNVEDARGLDLKLEYPSGDVHGFYKLLLRHHRIKGIPCVGEKWVEDLIAFKMYSIALLRCGNDLVAGTMIKEFKDTVSFPFTSLPDASKKSRMFAYNLYWMLIRKFATRGKRIFHSGRIPMNDQADDYRLGWGGAKFNYYYQYYPETSARMEFASKRGRKRELFEALWRRIPESLSSIIGPFIVKQFP